MLSSTTYLCVVLPAPYDLTSSAPCCVCVLSYVYLAADSPSGCKEVQNFAISLVSETAQHPPTEAGYPLHHESSASWPALTSGETDHGADVARHPQRTYQKLSGAWPWARM